MKTETDVCHCARCHKPIGPRGSGRAGGDLCSQDTACLHAQRDHFWDCLERLESAYEQAARRNLQIETSKTHEDQAAKPDGWSSENQFLQLTLLHEQIALMCEAFGSKREQQPCDSWHLRDLIVNYKRKHQELELAYKNNAEENARLKAYPDPGKVPRTVDCCHGLKMWCLSPGEPGHEPLHQPNTIGVVHHRRYIDEIVNGTATDPVDVSPSVPTTVTLRLPYLKHADGSKAEIVLEDVSLSALYDNGFVPLSALTRATLRRDCLYSETVRLSKEVVSLQADVHAERTQKEASSGKAAGDGVTHANAKLALDRFRQGEQHDGDHALCWRYIDQQEQSEREAAGLRKELEIQRHNVEVLDQMGKADQGARDEMCRQRDAERAQKEAVERLFEDSLKLVAEGDERERALRAENERLSANGRMYIGDTMAAIEEAAPVPTPNKYAAENAALMMSDRGEAAPVAKEVDLGTGERTVRVVCRQRPEHPGFGVEDDDAPVAKAEAPSEPAACTCADKAWSPLSPFSHRNDCPVAGGKCRACGSLLLKANRTMADGCPCNSPRGVNHNLVPDDACTCLLCDPLQTGSSRFTEPAPQPPAAEINPQGWRRNPTLLPETAECRHRWVARDGSCVDCDAPGLLSSLEPPATTGGADRPFETVGALLRLTRLMIETERREPNADDARPLAILVNLTEALQSVTAKLGALEKKT